MRVARTLIIIVSSVFFAAFFSCNKPDDIGFGVLPSTDKINTFFCDTSEIYGFTVAEDSLPVSGSALLKQVAYNILGSYTDPIFGTSNSTLYSQMNLTKASFSFGDSPVADSMVICLAIKDYYGDTLFPLHFKVYELDENVSDTALYYSNKKFNYSYLIGDAVSIVSPHDSTGELGVKKAPHVRIKLFNSFANRMMQQAGTANFVDNKSFIKYFKGLYIVSETNSGFGQGVLFSFDYINAQTKIALYYRSKGIDGEQSLNFRLDDWARVNNFSHNYSGSQVGMDMADTTSGANYLSAQSMAGTKVKIKLPNLSSFGENKIAVNRAVLILKADVSDSKYPPHSKLAIAGIDSTGKAQVLPDAYPIEPSNVNDGYLGSASHEYRFNITRYVQEVATGKRKNYGLYILSSGAIINMYRTRLYGYNQPSGKIRLEVNYSKY